MGIFGLRKKTDPEPVKHLYLVTGFSRNPKEYAFMSISRFYEATSIEEARDMFNCTITSKLFSAGTFHYYSTNVKQLPDDYVLPKLTEEVE